MSPSAKNVKETNLTISALLDCLEAAPKIPDIPQEILDHIFVLVTADITTKNNSLSIIEDGSLQIHRRYILSHTRSDFLEHLNGDAALSPHIHAPFDGAIVDIISWIMSAFREQVEKVAEYGECTQRALLPWLACGIFEARQMLRCGRSQLAAERDNYYFNAEIDAQVDLVDEQVEIAEKQMEVQVSQVYHFGVEEYRHILLETYDKQELKLTREYNDYFTAKLEESR